MIARNKEIKTDKFHIDTLMTEKTNSFWVFENDSIMQEAEINKEFVDESIKKIIKDQNFDQQWYSDNLGIQDKENLAVYTSEFHTNGGFDCTSIYGLIDDSFDFFVDLYMSYSDTAGLLEQIKEFQTSGITNEQMDVKFVEYVTRAANDKENFNQNFLMYFDNVDNKGFIKGLIELSEGTAEYEKFAEAWLKKDTVGQLTDEIKEQKLGQYIDKTLTTAPLLMDKPRVQATIQIPIEIFPALMQKFSKKIKDDNVLDWLKNNCRDLFSAKQSLCETIKSKTCGGKAISNKVLGLSLIFAQFFISPIFNPAFIDQGGNGLKVFFPYLPRTSIKEMYNNFEIEDDKTVFKCIFEDENNYKKENILRGYLNYKNEQIQREEIKLKDYIASIFEDSDERDKLSPAKGLEVSGSLGIMDVPEDCKECFILEIRSFFNIPSHVESHLYFEDQFGDQTKSFIPRKEVLMKDVPVWFKNFSKEFFEMKEEEFDMSADPVDERII